MSCACSDPQCSLYWVCTTGAAREGPEDEDQCTDTEGQAKGHCRQEDCEEVVVLGQYSGNQSGLISFNKLKLSNGAKTLLGSLARSRLPGCYTLPSMPSRRPFHRPLVGGSCATRRSNGGMPMPLPRTRPSNRRLTYSPCSDFALDVDSCSSNQSAQAFSLSGFALHLQATRLSSSI